MTSHFSQHGRCWGTRVYVRVRVSTGPRAASWITLTALCLGSMLVGVWKQSLHLPVGKPESQAPAL